MISRNYNSNIYLLIAEITAMICSGVIPFSNSMACYSLVAVESSGSGVTTCPASFRAHSGWLVRF